MLLGLKELGLGVGLWGKIKELKKKADLCNVINNRFVLKSAKGAKKGDLGTIIYNRCTCDLSLIDHLFFPCL